MEVKQLERRTTEMYLLDDEALLYLVHCGDREALDYLLVKYTRLVQKKARTYFMIGADRDDIIQEGMIGLYKAVRDFDRDKLTSFRGFADICVTRQIITAIKSATRLKHTPLNTYVSLDKPLSEEGSERTLIDIIAGASAADPEELLVNQEKVIDLEQKLSAVLSSLEKEALRLYMDGCTYQEISEKLNRHVKSIDNALQRVKRKLEHSVQTKEIQLI